MMHSIEKHIPCSRCKYKILLRYSSTLLQSEAAMDKLRVFDILCCHCKKEFQRERKQYFARDFITHHDIKQFERERISDKKEEKKSLGITTSEIDSKIIKSTINIDKIKHLHSIKPFEKEPLDERNEQFSLSDKLLPLKEKKQQFIYEEIESKHEIKTHHSQVSISTLDTIRMQEEISKTWMSLKSKEEYVKQSEIGSSEMVTNMNKPDQIRTDYGNEYKDVKVQRTIFSKSFELLHGKYLSETDDSPVGKQDDFSFIFLKKIKDEDINLRTKNYKSSSEIINELIKKEERKGRTFHRIKKLLQDEGKIKANELMSKEENIKATEQYPNKQSNIDKLNTRDDKISTRDDKLITRIDKLGPRRDKLGIRGDTLGTREDKLGARHDKLDTRGDKLGTRRDKLETSRDKLSTRDDKLGARYDKLGTRSNKLGSRDDKLGNRGDKLGSRDDKLGTRDDKLGTSGNKLGTRDNKYLIDKKHHTKENNLNQKVETKTTKEEIKQSNKRSHEIQNEKKHTKDYKETPLQNQINKNSGIEGKKKTEETKLTQNQEKELKNRKEKERKDKDQKKMQEVKNSKHDKQSARDKNISLKNILKKESKEAAVKTDTYNQEDKVNSSRKDIKSQQTNNNQNLMEDISPKNATRSKIEIEIAALEDSKGLIRYSLSDRTYIDKGWTTLPTEKVVRKMNVYRMRPAHPEFNWFENNKNKIMYYDTGEKLAEIGDDGRGRWFYRNGKLALDYYDSEELNSQQRIVVYSNGEPDEHGRSRPLTVLATFDYLGNGVVFDHGGKIRLKYNQTEGILLDRSIGPVSHWKWHTLNDPPVLQQVMIETQMVHKDPDIMNLGAPKVTKKDDNEDMLAIEFENFIKEKSKRLSQKFKPYQIKMKALKINENFSFKILDQATVHLIYRDGSNNLKLNIGMILDNKEIIDTDLSDVGEISNNLERLPAKSDSLAAMQKSVKHAQRVQQARIERERRFRDPSASLEKLNAAISRHRPRGLYSDTKNVANSLCQCRYTKFCCNLYYDTSLI